MPAIIGGGEGRGDGRGCGASGKLLSARSKNRAGACIRKGKIILKFSKKVVAFQN